MDLIVDNHNDIAKELRDNNTETEKVVLNYEAYMKLRKEPGKVILHASGKEEFHGITIECDPKQTEELELISRQ